MIAPWLDFKGNEINEGDVIMHPSGEIGIVMFRPERTNPDDQWMVNYGDNFESRLALQIGDKGQAVKVDYHIATPNADQCSAF